MALLWLGSLAATAAHDPGLSAADLRLEGGRLLAHLSFARADIERLVPMDTDRDGRVSAAELAVARPPLEELARGSLGVRFDGRGVAAESVAVSVDTSNNVHFYLTFVATRGGQLRLRSTLLTRFPLGHRQYLSIRDANGRMLVERMLDAGTETVAVNTSGAARGSAPHRFRQFLVLGIHHILTGYDHLLFLLGLLLPGFRLRTAIAIITSFTLAHSLTLTVATFDLVRLPARVVEPLIALSIMYVGVENLLRPDPSRRWLLTFGFGLVHGFGFATVLRNLGIGAGSGGALVPLLSFNLGVEVGQMAVAAVVLPLLWRLRRRPGFARRAVPVGSILVSLAGGYWLIERTLFS